MHAPNILIPPGNPGAFTDKSLWAVAQKALSRVFRADSNGQGLILFFFYLAYLFLFIYFLKTCRSVVIRNFHLGVCGGGAQD